MTLRKERSILFLSVLSLMLIIPGVVGDHPEYHLEDHSEKRLF